MTPHRSGLIAALLVLALACSPALADDEAPPPDAAPPEAPTPPPPPPPPPVEEVAVIPMTVVQAPAFRAKVVAPDTVEEINQILRGRCYGPEYAMRFTLVLEDEDEDDIELVARGPQSTGRVELFELQIEADEGEVEIEFLDEEDDDELDLDEDEELDVTLLWKDGELILREDDDEVLEVEPDEDELPALCHVFTFEVQEEFYIRDLEIQPLKPR